MSKHSLLSAQLWAIKATGKDHVWAELRPMFTCVFWICLGWRREASQVHTQPFHVWPGPGDDPPTWSHRSRTGRQITVLKDTLRDAQTGEQMGPGKNLAPPFISPPAIIQFDPLAPSVFVMRENVARGFVKRRGGFRRLHMRKNWKRSLRARSCHHASALFHPD